MSINASVARSFLAMTPVPGVAVSAVLALAALQLNTLDPLAWASPMVIAMILGMIARNTVGAPTWAAPGIHFTMRRLLRLGIVLLGLRLSLTQLAAIASAAAPWLSPRLRLACLSPSGQAGYWVLTVTFRC